MSPPNALEACQKAMDWAFAQEDYASSSDSLRLDELRHILAAVLDDPEARKDVRMAAAWETRATVAERRFEEAQETINQVSRAREQLAKRLTDTVDVIADATGVRRELSEIYMGEEARYAERALRTLRRAGLRGQLAGFLEAVARRLR